MQSYHRIGRQLEHRCEILDFIDRKLTCLYFSAGSEFACWDANTEALILTDGHKQVLCVDNVLDSLELIC